MYCKINSGNYKYSKSKDELWVVSYLRNEDLLGAGYKGMYYKLLHSVSSIV